MDRINGANTVDIGGGRRGFRDRNLVAGLAGTQVTAAHMNATQEEILAVIEEAGITPNAANWGQLLAALQTMFGGEGELLASGWWRFPGGLMVNWGSVTVPTTTGVTWVYPEPFPSALFGVFLTQLATGANAETLYVSSANQTQAVIDNLPGTNAQIAYCLAIGH